MQQPDNTNVPSTTDVSPGSSPPEGQYLVEISSCGDIIRPIIEMISDPNSQWVDFIANNGTKLRSSGTQIGTVINIIKKMDRNPPGINFNKTAVLENLKQAREELNKALLISGDSDKRVAADSFPHITALQDYLENALDLISAALRHQQS